MFLRRKTGTGATARRRPSRECNVGIEGLDTRAVPTLIFPAPGSPLVESGQQPASLSVAFDEYGHGFARTDLTNPFTGQPTITAEPLLTNRITGPLTAVPGVTGPGTANPLTLAYRLPTPVWPGDVAVVNFQTGQLSDLIRFTDSVDTFSITGWMLYYSNTGPGHPADAPADTGIPAFTITPFTQIATEFGVEGYEVIQYAADGGSLYSGLSDGNLLPIGGDPASVPEPSSLILATCGGVVVLGSCWGTAQIAAKISFKGLVGRFGSHRMVVAHVGKVVERLWTFLS